MRRPRCKRKGCRKVATGDEFCSATCCRLHHGIAGNSATSVKTKPKALQA